MIDCISRSEPSDINLTSVSNEDGLSIGSNPQIATDLATKSNFKAIDFDPFIDGEILLTAPATESQQEIWLGVQIGDEANLACILSQSLRFTGRLDLDLLHTAFDRLVDRHESLRATFNSDGTTILIAKKITFQAPVVDLSMLTASEKSQAVATYQQQATSQKFDIQHGPLFKTRILKLADREHIAIFSVHHLICDGWSLGVISTDLAKIYTALDRGSEPQLAQPAYFSEYAFLEHAKIGSVESLATETYWLEKFAKLPPVLDLPTDYPRPPIRTFNSAIATHPVTASLADRLKQLGANNGCSLMTTLLAAFEVWLFKLTGATDLTVGVPTAGQIAADRSNLVGHCVHFLPLRSQIDSECKFSEYLRARNRAILDDYEHQDFTFGSLLKKLAIPREASRVPLISAAFNIDLTGTNTDIFSDLAVETRTNHNPFATFELFLNAVPRPNGQIDLECRYNPNLFSAATIGRRLSEFENLLTDLVETPDRSIQSRSLLSLSQQQQLLVTWNQTQTDYPRQCIHQLFEAQTATDSEAIALSYNGQQLTYGELNRRANQLAHYSIALGIQPDEVVGIAVDRSIDSIVAILAILKAGGAYLPLDLTAPPARIAAILADARVAVVLTNITLMAQLPTGLKVLCLDADRDKIAQSKTTNPARPLRPTNLAYVMYTSGSTGQPKGVCIPHQAVVRLVKSTNYLNFSPELVFLQLAPLAFDAATFEIWGSLLNGAKLVLYPGDKPALVELGQILAREQITTLWLTAGLFHLMVDERLADLQPLRHLIAGGDVLSIPHVQQVLATLPDCQLINGYGPTENTTFTCCYAIDRLDPLATSIPIGQPIANTQVYLLDPQLQPVPIGIPGELYIGGDGLASGYLHRPDLTREKFISNPFADTEKIYRTGDLARYLPDGNLEFLGRIDNQVKIRGFRIEIGEIEAVLMQHPSVQAAVVTLRADRGDKRLVAYLVPHPPQQPTEREIRAFLESRLPDYLIPSAIVLLAALPLTTNGKVDRRSLPSPDTRPEPTTIQAPRDELELQLTAMWERVLDIHPIGIRDNFFELGGHSLIAVRLFAQIEQTWGQNLPLAILLQKQTIEELAAVLRQEEWSAAWSSLVPIRPALTEASGDLKPSKPPLFCIHPVGGNVFEYHTLANYLEPDRSIYGLQSQGLGGQPALRRVEDMASHYIQEIRTVQPQGPYFLAGYSFGGLVAYEMARQLAARGQQIALLALLDSSAPDLPTRRPAFFQAVGVHLGNLWQLDPQERSSYIMGRIEYRLQGGNQREFLAQNLYDRADLTPQLLAVLDANLAAAQDYVAQFYPGKLTLLRCQVQDLEHHLHPEFGWQHLVESMEIHPIPGPHSSMLKEPRIQTLAATLQDCLQRSQTGI